MRAAVALTVALCLTASAAGAAKPNPLLAYVGKYPYDKVHGIGFLHQPAVAAGVKKAVADKTIRGWVLNDETTQTPIGVKDGSLLSQACEPHNCGDHQWTIVIDLASGATDVCYHDGAEMKEDQSRWYLASGKNELRNGDCPAGG